MTSAKISPLPSPATSTIAEPDAPAPGKQAAPPRRAFLEVLREGGGAAGAPSPQPAAAPRPAEQRPAAASLRNVIAGAFQAERNIDVVLEAAARRRTFSANELLAIQVQVFRYSQTVDVLSRTTDKLVTAVKQTLGTQV